MADASKKENKQTTIPVQIDGGAAPNVISGELVRRLQLIKLTSTNRIAIHPVNGSPVHTKGKVKIHLRVAGDRVDLEENERAEFTIAIECEISMVHLYH